MMESQLACLNPTQRTHIIKGKRTKRPRTLSPTRPVTSTSSCGGDDSSGDVSDHARIDTNNNLHSSPSSSIEVRESGGGGEEEDMANCLILLAQGNHHHHRRQKTPSPEATKTSYIYHCKTCNKCFSSFQALGGHRASHKKPNIKISRSEDNQRKVTDDGEDEEHSLNDKQSDITNKTRSIFSNMNTTLSLQISDNMIKSNKVHECSICGAEFSSGQALGGHMRRHRTATTARLVTGSLEDEEHKKPRRDNLQLDLNLPAPLEDNDYRESKFLFGSKEQVLVFSPSNLVDCHY